MQLLASKESNDYITKAITLGQEFALTTAERDIKGGTPKYERDRLRESDLLQLIIPREYGGMGEMWPTAMKIVREFAKVDSSIAHLLGYHYLQLATLLSFGTKKQWEKYCSASVRNNWFWGNAINPLDRNVTATPDGKNLRLKGVKSFCSGAKDSDVLVVSAHKESNSRPIVAIIPSEREGIVINDDWDNIGQRQTDSGSVSFRNVLVLEEEVLGPPGPLGSPFATMRTCVSQLNLTNVYLGMAQGAFEEAKRYTTTTTKPWLTSGVESATQDPYIMHHYGDMWINLSAAAALTEQAAEVLQAAWQEGERLTPELRGECAVAIAAAKVLVTRVGLDITTRMFEVMGARATAAKYRFDRYWRNVRTFTLHDPVDYKVREVGNWALNDHLPTPGFYS